MHKHLNARILIVDDDAINRRLLKSMLSTNGYNNLCEAADGLDALTAIQNALPDLILLDLHMPNLSGFDVCKTMRAKYSHEEMPILVISQLEQNNDRVSAFDSGATDLVGKPFNKMELMARVQIHLSMKFLTGDLVRYQRRLQQELRSAYDIQKSLLPSKQHLDELQEKYNIIINGYCQPSSELGGDMWDIDALDDETIWFYLVDFSGHGVHAALHTVWLNAYLAHNPLSVHDKLNEYMTRINNALHVYMPKGYFATMLMGKIDYKNKTIQYCSAAHPQLIIWDDKEEVYILDSKSLPLGIIQDAQFEVVSRELTTKSHIFVYSDGLLHPALSDDPITEDILNNMAIDNSPEIFLEIITDKLRQNSYRVPDDNTFFMIGMKS